MGKKGTKRKTRWRALPLGEEDGGSGAEEETFDEDRSTTSSILGQPTNVRTHPDVFRVGEKSYRQSRRFPYDRDRFRSKEPLIKLESKTFDEEEYTKITTPRQDVLFKKGYFGRKRESSIEESFHYTGEVEGEEAVMDQIIITNGFVDERGHYLVNGNSYEIYDPYTNTVTVVVGPPPYTNGVTQPVLAAVSCQPVPLHPLDWYPPGSEWPGQGPPWTPPYQPEPLSDTVSSPGQSCESSGSQGSEGQPPVYPPPPFVVPGYIYGGPPQFNPDAVPFCDGQNPATEVSCSNDSMQDKKLKKRRRKVLKKTSDGQEYEEEVSEEEEEERTLAVGQKEEEIRAGVQMIQKCQSAPQMNSDSTANPTPSEFSYRHDNNPDCSPHIESDSTNDLKLIEKQSHSTQTNSDSRLAPQGTPVARVKESHSTQTILDETFPNKLKAKIQTENEKNQCRSPSDILLSSISKQQEQEEKSPTKTWNRTKEWYRTSPRRYPDDYSSPKKPYQKRTTYNERKSAPPEPERRVDRIEIKPPEKIPSSPVKTSYARKVMNGLENGNTTSPKPVTNGVNPLITNGTKTVNGTNGINKSNHVTNGFVPNGTKPELKRSNSKGVMNGNAKNGYDNSKNGYDNSKNGYDNSKNGYDNSKNGYDNSKNGYDNSKNGYDNSKNGYDSSKNGYDNSKNGYDNSKNGYDNSKNGYDNSKHGYDNSKHGYEKPRSKPNVRSAARETKKVILKSVEKTESKDAVNESRSQSEKSSSVSELSSPTELSSGQNTPPEKAIVQKMEQKIANEINKSVEEKLTQNLDETGTESDTKPEVKPGKKKKNKAKADEEKTKETPKSSNSVKKKKKKQYEEVKDEEEEGGEGISFLPTFLQQKPQSFLLHGSDESDLLTNFDSILTTDEDEILKSLGVKDESKNFSKLPLKSDLMMSMSSFLPDRPKFKFDDYFTSTSTKQLHSDIFTKTNITNMRSTKPEEFFASIVDNPPNDFPKKSSKPTTKKEQVSTDTTTEKLETAKEANNGAQVIVKKGLNLPKTGYKINKNNVKCKVTKGEKNEKAAEEAEEVKKNKEKEEVKLKIVDAVNNWLQEQGDSDKVLSVNSLPQAFDRLDDDDDGEDEDDVSGQKNGLSNPLHALSANECRRVAREIFDNDDELLTKKDALKKHLKSLSESAHDLISDVKNGISPTRQIEVFDSDAEDALEYKFRRGEPELANGTVSNQPFPTKEVCCKLQ